MRLDTRASIERGEGLARLYGARTVGTPLRTQEMSTEVVRRQPGGNWLFALDNPRAQE